MVGDFTTLSPYASNHELPSGMYLVYLDLSLALARISSRVGLEMESQAIQEVTRDFVRWTSKPCNEEQILMFLHYIDDMNEYGDFTRADAMLYFATRKFPTSAELRNKEQEIPKIRAEFCQAHNITTEEEFQTMDKASRNKIILRKRAQRGLP